MGRIIKKQGIGFNLTEWALYDTLTERVYSRIAGGIGWPSTRPGALVIVAQEIALRPPAQLFVLDAREVTDLDGLIRMAIENREDFHVDNFYGDTSRVEEMNFLMHFNSEAQSRKAPQLQVHQAPHSKGGRIVFHINAIKSALTAGSKTLNLGEGANLLRAELSSLPQMDVAAAKAAEHPLLAALGYALVELKSHVEVISKPATVPGHLKSFYGPGNKSNMPSGSFYK